MENGEWRKCAILGFGGRRKGFCMLGCSLMLRSPRCNHDSRPRHRLFGLHLWMAMRGCKLLASSLARRPPLPLVRRLASLLTKPAVLRRLVSTGASHAAVAPGASPAVPAASGSALAVALRTKRLRLPLLGKLSVSELFGHTAFALAATAFLDPDILNLRLLSVASGAATLIFTYYHPVGRPLWLPFGWNVLFMTINAGHIYSILSSKWEAERMPPQAVDLWKAVFSHQGVSAVDFNKLLACGTWTTLRKGTALQAEGQPSASIFLLVQGGADVSVGGTKTHRLSQHQFIGDMGLSSGIAISQPVRGVATVTTNQQTTCLVWSRAALHELLEREPMLRVRASRTQRALGRGRWALHLHARHSHSPFTLARPSSPFTLHAGGFPTCLACKCSLRRRSSLPHRRPSNGP